MSHIGSQSPKELLDQCAVFIRSIGERTEDVCRHSIQVNGIDPGNIHLIKNISPFSRALVVGYERAIEQGKKYSVFVDADMILLPNALSCMLMAFDCLPARAFCMIPACYTYTTGIISSGGPKVYRTSLLHHAIPLVPHEKQSLRPETFTVKKMNRHGYDLIFLDVPVAGQDFGQYHRDTFAKTVGRYIKTPDKRFEQRANGLANTLEEFSVVRAAIRYAEEHKPSLSLSEGEFDDAFQAYNLGEREAIKDSEAYYGAFLKELDVASRDYVSDSYSVRHLAAIDNVRALNAKLTTVQQGSFGKRLRTLVRRLVRTGFVGLRGPIRDKD
jgi:hypothetical protein